MRRVLVLSAGAVLAVLGSVHVCLAAPMSYSAIEMRATDEAVKVPRLSLDLVITSGGKTFKSSGIVVSGELFSISSLEKREYVSDITMVDGIKKGESKGVIDFGSVLNVRPRILPGGKIVANISFENTVATPGTKPVAPHYFQPHDYQSLTQVVVLNNGEPMSIAALSTPDNDKELAVTITAKYLP